MTDEDLPSAKKHDYFALVLDLLPACTAGQFFRVWASSNFHGSAGETALAVGGASAIGICAGYALCHFLRTRVMKTSPNRRVAIFNSLALSLGLSIGILIATGLLNKSTDSAGVTLDKPSLGNIVTSDSPPGPQTLVDQRKTTLAWYAQQAEKGDAEAQNALGLAYASGDGLPQDYVQAVRWFRKAADQGFASAQNYLGVSYQNGFGVRKDHAQAAQWFRKAADQGLAEGQFNLGVMNYEGIGVPKDYAQALWWYRKAAAQDFASALVNLGAMYSDGKGVARDYAQAMWWYRKAADQGHASAQYNIGVMYNTGRGIPKDYVQAAQWFRKAADQGFANAQASLGFIYHEGHGVPKDYTQAMKWYAIAKASDPPSISQLNVLNHNLRLLESRSNPAQIAEAQRMAREWWSAHTFDPTTAMPVDSPLAAQGNSSAQ